jgi:histidinol-phosphate aminotransferase
VRTGLKNIARVIESIARHHFIDASRVAVANDTGELIRMLAAIRRDDNRAALITGHTVAAYEKSLRVNGIPVIEVPLVNYRVPAPDLALHLDRGAGLAFVCNPHDPTGSVLSGKSVRLLCDAAMRNNALVVFDETYAEYALGTEFVSARWWARYGRNVCVIRTFPQSVAYLLGDPSIIAEVTRISGGFPRPTERAVDRKALAQARKDNNAARDVLCRGLTELGIGYVPSVTNFVLARLPDRGHHRIPVGRPEETATFLADLKKRVAR